MRRPRLDVFSSQPFSVGGSVEVHGLKTASKDNALCGRIVSFSAATGRYGVLLCGYADPKSIVSANLRLLGDLTARSMVHTSVNSAESWQEDFCALRGGPAAEQEACSECARGN